MDIPERLTHYLVEGETVEDSFKVKGGMVYATNRRLFDLRGKQLTDVDYDHISSLQFRKEKRDLILLAAGILIVVASFLLTELEDITMYIFVFGLTTVIAGIIIALRRPEELVVYVVGRESKEKELRSFQGDRKHLDLLFKTIREKTHR